MLRRYDWLVLALYLIIIGTIASVVVVTLWRDLKKKRKQIKQGE